MGKSLLPGERVVRRQGSREQGQALETLGHAVEYLMDSSIFLTDEASAAAQKEAAQVLMRLSRLVFLDCPEVVPVRQRVGRWLSAGVARVTRQGAQGNW